MSAFFNFELPSIQWAKRYNKFEIKFGASDNLLCKILAHKQLVFVPIFDILSDLVCFFCFFL